MPTPANISILDHSDESTSFQFNVNTIDETNLAATQTAIDALKTAIGDANFILGGFQNDTISVKRPDTIAVSPAAGAQRELKWSISYKDITAELAAGVPNPGFDKRFNVEMGTANASLLGVNTDQLDLGNVDVAAVVTAFESLVKSPYGGDVEVIRIRLVGRNI